MLRRLRPRVSFTFTPFDWIIAILIVGGAIAYVLWKGLYGIR